MSITGEVHDYWNKASCGTWRTQAPKHSRQYFDDIEAERYRLEPCIPAFAKFQDFKQKSVLEVGVGAGTDFTQFARNGARMSGVDLTEEAIENADKRLSVYGLPPADLKVCNAENLPFSDASFDLVYSWGVIHHANDTPQCLREIARVTKADGKIKLMLYNLNSTFAWALSVRYREPNRRKAIWNHMESIGTKAYAEAEVRAMAKSAGLRVNAITYGEQLIAKGAKFEGIRRFIQNRLPSRWLWYMMIDLEKI